MGYNLASTAACSSGRHARVGSRKRKIADVDAALTLLSIEKMQPPQTDEQTDYHTVTVGEQAVEQAIEQAVEPAIEQAVEQVIDDRTHAQESQTDVTAEDISYLEEDNRARVAESSEPTFSIYDRGCYVGAPEKACFYTGLPSVEILDVVFELVEQHMTSSVKLTRYNQMLLCLIRLRMNYLFKDIAYQLRISLSTVQRSFHATLDVLHAKLAFLIRWPDREQLRKTMPMCFRVAYQNKVVVILDCFELFTETASGARNQVETYSHYKHHQTVKYLIGISPQGSVTFISAGWGGRVSDKHSAEVRYLGKFVAWRYRHGWPGIPNWWGCGLLPGKACNPRCHEGQETTPPPRGREHTKDSERPHTRRESDRFGGEKVPGVRRRDPFGIS